MDGESGPAKLCSSMARGDVAAVGEDVDSQGRSTRRKEEEAAAAGEGKETPAGKGLWRLADEEVQWVLSRKRTHLVSGEVSPEGVEAFESLADSFFEYQAWVRTEYEANGGYVEVDDEFAARREEHQRWLAERLVTMVDAIDFSGWNVSDRLSDFYDSDSDEDEGEEVVQKPETN